MLSLRCDRAISAKFSALSDEFKNLMTGSGFKNPLSHFISHKFANEPTRVERCTRTQRARARKTFEWVMVHIPPSRIRREGAFRIPRHSKSVPDGPNHWSRSCETTWMTRPEPTSFAQTGLVNTEWMCEYPKYDRGEEWLGYIFWAPKNLAPPASWNAVSFV